MKRSLWIFCIALAALALTGALVVGISQWMEPNWACPLSVMVDGVLYYTYEEEAPAPEEAQICGEIQSRSAPISGMPTEDGTSSFDSCVGQPYAFVEGELLLCYGGRWNRCVPAEEP